MATYSMRGFSFYNKDREKKKKKAKKTENRKCPIKIFFNWFRVLE